MESSIHLPRYQKQELLAYAHEQGFQVTEHLLKDWVEKGLIGEAYREWPGRGSVSWWSRAQRNLFLELLELRQRREKPLPIGLLCTVPIGKWLYLGEKIGGVSLPQVRRAMSTWMDFQQKFSSNHIAHCATKLMKQYEDPKAGGKRRLIRHLTDLAVFRPGLTPEEIQQVADREELQYDLDAVLIPGKTAQKKLVENHFAKDLFCTKTPIFFQVLQSPQPFLEQPDAIWKWARMINLLTLGSDQRDQPSFVADQQVEPLISRFMLDSLIESSGFDLIGLLGIARLKEFKPSHPLLDPQAWIEEKVTSPVIQPKPRMPFSLLLVENIALLQYEFILGQGTMTSQYIQILIPRQFFR